MADCSVVGLQESCYPQCARGILQKMDENCNGMKMWSANEVECFFKIKEIWRKRY
jgi:hypothetical protein